MFISGEAVPVSLHREEPEAGDGDGLVKLGGEIPWVGETAQYFPEDLMGLTVEDEAGAEYLIVKAEYDLTPCGHRYVKNIWLMPERGGICPRQ